MSYLNNSRTRTPLDQQPALTVKFKTVYPDYASFEAALTAKNIDVSDTAFVQRIFAYLEEMIGNAYMRWTTSDKNKGFTAWNWQKFYKPYQKLKEFYDKNISEMAQDKVTSAAKLFKVNNTASGQLEAKFLANGTTNDQTATANLLDRYNALEDWASRTDPELRFISNMALALVTPYQRETFGEIY